MAERSPSAISKNIEPLAKWYSQFKPDVKRLVLSQDDYDRLKTAVPDTLTRNSFRRVGESFFWKDFELVRK